VPYRRGYLLYGPPGTGKTSFTQAVAGALKLNICYLNLSGGNMDDDGLNRALNDAPSHSIILLEDIDGIFVGRESVSKGKGGGARGVTFSGLLNALDGVRSQEGRILFMTTNHREKLDPALMRPGRADFHAHLNNATHEQMKQLFLKFNPDRYELAEEFARQLPELKISMAKLQGHFLKYRGQPETQVEKAKQILEDSGSLDEMSVAEYLRRLNLDKYAANFTEQGIYFVTDLRHYANEGEITANLKITKPMHVKRLACMIQGEKITQNDFSLISVATAR